MKIYFCHSREFDYKNDLYKPVRESALNKQHEVIFPHEDDFSTINTKDVIKTCDVIFAEVSFPATGLGIELGWADIYSVPIVCFHKTGAKVSGSLKFITNNFIEYSDSNDLVNKIESFLTTPDIQASPAQKKSREMAIPFVGGIIERNNNGETEILMQTRWKPNRDPVYSGTLEFPAGVLDEPYENVYDALKREIKEECGLTLKKIHGDSQTKRYTPKGNDESFGFRPYCCVQQLKNGKPWIGFIFICEVESGEAKAQASEVKDVQWMKVSEIKRIFESEPEKLFTLEISAWEFYFKELTTK